MLDNGMVPIRDALSAVVGCPEVLPDWVATAPYLASAHPRAADLPALVHGANCQRYAYAVLELFGRRVPPYRSSELWEETDLERSDRMGARDLDLVLFNDRAESWGAHIAVVVGTDLLHLCAEVGRPALWDWTDFAARDRYREVVGLIRIPRNP